MGSKKSVFGSGLFPPNEFAGSKEELLSNNTSTTRLDLNSAPGKQAKRDEEGTSILGKSCRTGLTVMGSTD